MVDQRDEPVAFLVAHEVVERVDVQLVRRHLVQARWRLAHQARRLQRILRRRIRGKRLAHVLLDGGEREAVGSQDLHELRPAAARSMFSFNQAFQLASSARSRVMGAMCHRSGRARYCRSSEELQVESGARQAPERAECRRRGGGMSVPVRRSAAARADRASARDTPRQASDARALRRRFPRGRGVLIEQHRQAQAAGDHVSSDLHVGRSRHHIARTLADARELCFEPLAQRIVLRRQNERQIRDARRLAALPAHRWKVARTPSNSRV